MKRTLKFVDNNPIIGQTPSNHDNSYREEIGSLAEGCVDNNLNISKTKELNVQENRADKKTQKPVYISAAEVEARWRQHPPSHSPCCRPAAVRFWDSSIHPPNSTNFFRTDFLIIYTFIYTFLHYTILYTDNYTDSWILLFSTLYLCANKHHNPYNTYNTWRTLHKQDNYLKVTPVHWAVL